MTINQLKEKILTRFSEYWGGATVVWGAANKVKPLAPLVVLQLGPITRTTQPITQMINGIVFSAYPSEASLQVDLFTKGNTVETPEGAYAENTATSDLLDFINYLDSPATVEWSGKNNVGVSLIGSVQDLSDVINDSRWQYRAMAEIRLTFTQWAAEHNGILNESSIVFNESGVPVGVIDANWQQTASGGGTEDLARAKSGAFEDAPIKHTGGV